MYAPCHGLGVKCPFVHIFIILVNSFTNFSEPYLSNSTHLPCEKTIEGSSTFLPSGLLAFPFFILRLRFLQSVHQCLLFLSQFVQVHSDHRIYFIEHYVFSCC